MSRNRIISGVVIVIIAITVLFFAIFVPDNELFRFFWERGIGTIQGEGSTELFISAGGILLVLGGFLLLDPKKIKKTKK